MTIEIEVKQTSKFLHLTAQGSYTLAGLLETFEGAFRAAINEGRSEVLLDIRNVVGGSPTTMQRYDIGVHFAQLQRTYGMGIRIAIVGQEPIIDPNKFGESVGRNRGAVSRVFTEIDEAIQWLERKSGD